MITMGQRTWGCEPRGGGRLFIEGKGGYRSKAVVAAADPSSDGVAAWQRC
jgi:hypothetical protein